VLDFNAKEYPILGPTSVLFANMLQFPLLGLSSVTIHWNLPMLPLFAQCKICKYTTFTTHF
jgi:hypothetical protein